MVASDKVPCWKYEGKILDGRNRWRAAQEAGVPVLNWHTFEGTDEEALALAKLLNDERRHLTREGRAEWVKKLREQGMSTRAIADAVGASQPTVRRDLRSGESCDSPDAEPQEPEAEGQDIGAGEEQIGEQEGDSAAPAPSPDPPKVTGLDGKKYPATRPRKAVVVSEPKPEAAWCNCSTGR